LKKVTQPDIVKRLVHDNLAMLTEVRREKLNKKKEEMDETSSKYSTGTRITTNSSTGKFSTKSSRRSTSSNSINATNNDGMSITDLADKVGTTRTISLDGEHDLKGGTTTFSEETTIINEDPQQQQQQQQKGGTTTFSPDQIELPQSRGNTSSSNISMSDYHSKNGTTSFSNDIPLSEEQQQQAKSRSMMSQ